MKHRIFKIRSVTSQESGRNNQMSPDEKRTINHLQDIPQGSVSGQGSFNELVDMFKTFMKHSTAKPAPVPATPNYEIEARDREVIIEAPIVINGKIEEGELKRWISKIIKTVSSAAFHYFSRNEMSFDQAKVYCSENIFKNIVVLNRSYNLSAKEFEMIDTHIKKGVLDYLATKYPLTDSTDINKKLEENVHEIDNIEAISNNYFTNTSLYFEFREEGNYNDLIMAMMNDLMQFIDHETEDEKTNYTEFEEFMTTIFERVEDEDWMRKQDKEMLYHQLKLVHHNSEISSPGASEIRAGLEDGDIKEKLRKRNEEKEKYKSKVKEYTHYLIGRKIPENASHYTEKEIENKNMSIKNPTILRILTKWCGQLWEKFETTGYYANRSESIKVQKGGNINSLLAWMRKYLDEKMQDEKEEIKKYMQDLSENNFQMMPDILAREFEQKGDEHVDEVEKISGKFSVKVVNNLHSYIIGFLNRLIHGLMKVAKQMHDDYQLGAFSFWPSPVNLLTFKVGDLMRCKCSSKEKEILRIYKELQRISKENPEKMKIIRIKNRLKTGTNDILINIKFNDKILCEIQLAVKSKTSDFIKCSNLFHHYLYELQRSHFGPLTELCSIWNSLDRRIKVYQSLIELQDQSDHKKEHICKRLNKKFELLRYEKAFICSQCSHTYFHNNYLRNHGKCNLCDALICARCRLQDENLQSITSTCILNPNDRWSCTKIIHRNQPLPKVGFCILIESKIPKPQLFTFITSTTNSKDYILGKINGQIYEVQDISKSKLRLAFRKKHIILEINDPVVYPPIDQQQAERRYILPSIIRSNYKKQKESISLMDQNLSTEECRQILQTGSKSQKENVKNLFLVDNLLTSLPFNSEDFPNLRWITLSRNQIQTLQGLQKCHNLVNFIAISIGISQIPKELYDLKKMEKISISSNSITVIPDEIANFKLLTDLQLDGNAISQISEKISQCKNLSILKLQTNAIEKLPQSFHTLSKLNKVFLTSNNLIEIPEKIGDLKQLTELYINCNSSISTLPDSFFQLEKLQIFDGSQTSIAEMSEKWSQLTNLRQLKLGSTPIDCIPENIDQLKNLELIDLNTRYSSLTIPDSMGNLPKLENLNLSSCNIYQIPETFRNLKSLEVLTLNYNNLVGFDHSIFNDLPNLTNLSLEGCQCKYFPVLKSCVNMTKLNVSNNLIQQILDQNISGLVNIEELKINDNQLKYLPRKIIEMVRLERLEANSNKLESLLNPQVEEEIKSLNLTLWPKLKYCNFNVNLFTEIPSLILNCSKLDDLFMSNNKLTKIPPQISGLTRLKQLELNNNEIEEIQPNIAQLSLLHGVYMSFNKLKKIPAFMKNCVAMKTFYADNCLIEQEGLECAEWLIKQEITCGSLLELSRNKVYEGKYDAGNQNGWNLGENENNGENNEEYAEPVVEDKAQSDEGDGEQWEQNRQLKDEGYEQLQQEKDKDKANKQ